MAARSPGWRRHLPAARYLLALATLLVGLARSNHPWLAGALGAGTAG